MSWVSEGVKVELCSQSKFSNPLRLIWHVRTSVIACKHPIQKNSVIGKELSKRIEKTRKDMVVVGILCVGEGCSGGRGCV